MENEDVYSTRGNSDNTNNNNNDSDYAYLILCHHPDTMLSAFHTISNFRHTTVLRDSLPPFTEKATKAQRSKSSTHTGKGQSWIQAQNAWLRGLRFFITMLWGFSSYALCFRMNETGFPNLFKLRILLW